MSGGYPYNTARWKRLRAAHLSLYPLCIECIEHGELIASSVVDHIVAMSSGGPAYPGHDGLAALCPPCHSRKTARGPEAGAVRTSGRIKPRPTCDAKGAPLDPLHPWNERKSLRADGLNTALPPKIELVPDRYDLWA